MEMLITCLKPVCIIMSVAFFGSTIFADYPDPTLDIQREAVRKYQQKQRKWNTRYGDPSAPFVQIVVPTFNVEETPKPKENAEESSVGLSFKDMAKKLKTSDGGSEKKPGVLSFKDMAKHMKKKQPDEEEKKSEEVEF